MRDETDLDERQWLYWKNVLKEVLNKHTKHYRFLYTNYAKEEMPMRSLAVREEKSPAYRPRVMSRFYLGHKYPNAYLTAREAQCAYCLIHRKNIREIAEESGLSARTVEYYIKNVKKKLRCKRRTQLPACILDSEFVVTYENYLKTIGVTLERFR